MCGTQFAKWRAFGQPPPKGGMPSYPLTIFVQKTQKFNKQKKHKRKVKDYASKESIAQ